MYDVCSGVCKLLEQSRYDRGSVQPSTGSKALNPQPIDKLHARLLRRVATDHGDLVAVLAQLFGQAVDICLDAPAPRREETGGDGDLHGPTARAASSRMSSLEETYRNQAVCSDHLGILHCKVKVLSMKHPGVPHRTNTPEGFTLEVLYTRCPQPQKGKPIVDSSSPLARPSEVQARVIDSVGGLKWQLVRPVGRAATMHSATTVMFSIEVQTRANVETLRTVHDMRMMIMAAEVT